MATAITVREFLRDSRVPFDLVEHRHSRTSLQAARTAHVPPAQLAKAVLLEEHGNLVVVVVPANRHLHLGALRKRFGREFGMATEQTVARVFCDCDPGAIPAFGRAYGIETIWDDGLMAAGELYLESGDHEHLVHMRTEDFVDLVRECEHGEFSVPL